MIELRTQKLEFSMEKLLEDAADQIVEGYSYEDTIGFLETHIGRQLEDYEEHYIWDLVEEKESWMGTDDIGHW